jgi:hypothetical protein
MLSYALDSTLAIENNQCNSSIPTTISTLSKLTYVCGCSLRLQVFVYAIAVCTKHNVFL